MKIIKSLLIVCIAIALHTTANASSPFMKRIKPSGDVVTKTFDIPSSSYTKIDVLSLANVKIVEGDGDIVVKIDSNLESYLVIKVSEDELTIRLKKSITINGNCTFDVLVPCNSKLSEISTSGMVTLVSEVVLTGDNIRISASGMSDVTAIADGEHCEVEAAGMSDINLECKSETLKAEALGKSDINLDIVTSDCEAEAAGMSDISIKGETNHADLSATGMSDIAARGLGYKTIEVKESGMSDVSYRKK